MKKIAIFYDSKDVITFFSQNIDADKFLPITPNAKAELLNYKKNNILNVLDYFNVEDHKFLLINTRKYQEKFNKILTNKSYLNATKTTLENIFNLSLNSFFYLYIIINRIECIFIYNKNEKFIETQLKNEVIQQLIHKIIHNGYGPFGEKRNSTQFLPIINKLMLNFFLFLSKNKKKIIVSGQNYGLKNLINLTSKKNVMFLSIGNSDYLSIFKNFFNIMKYLFYKNNNFYILFASKDKKRIYLKDILKNFNNDHELFKLIKDDFINYLEEIGSYIENIYKSSKNIISKSLSKNIISHQFRMYEPALIGMIGSEFSLQNILISHGSHVLSQNSTEEIAHFNQAKDILFSYYSTINIAQSPLAMKCLHKYQSNKLNLPYKPIMWGYKLPSNINKFSNKISKIKLLHAGTSKQLCLRPYIYETANEYIEGLNILCDNVNSLSGYELVIKVRPTKDYSVKTLKKLIKTGKNCTIVESGDFVEYLSHSDYLISYSSTTIEEALNYNKPVILYGYDDEYKYLIDDNEIIYNASINNIKTVLQNIKTKHTNFVPKKEKFNKYIWDNNVNNVDKFIDKFVL